MEYKPGSLKKQDFMTFSQTKTRFQDKSTHGRFSITEFLKQRMGKGEKNQVGDGFLDTYFSYLNIVEPNHFIF